MNKRQEIAARAVEAGNFDVTNSGIIIPDASLMVGGVFSTEIIRDGISLGIERHANKVVNEGLNHLLGVVLSGVPAITSWFIGLWEDNVAPAADWTSNNLRTKVTECEAYDEGARQAWQEDGAASQQITNSTKATFTINLSKAVYGAFLTSASPNDGSADAAGTLFAASLFSVPRNVVDNDQLLVTYTVVASSTT